MPPAARVLLCCEAGAGRGHVTTLATVARALWPDHPCQAILARTTHADVLEPVCDRVDRGTHIGRVPQAPASSVLNWADWLLTRGFADPAILQPRFDWWCEALRAIRPGLVVADFAPTALLAARALGVRSVATGAAFGIPPSKLPQFPDYLTPQQAADHGTVLADAPPPDAAAICAAINLALGPRGLPPLAHLPQVYAADLALPAGVTLWDPYAAWRERPLLMPIDPLPPLQRRAGSEVFIYFSTAELEDVATCAALRRLPFAARLVAPGLTAELARDLAANPRLTIAPAPLSLNEIVARSRVILCAGQAGTLSLAVLAGIPVLALPVQLEQMSNALRAAAQLDSVRVLPRKLRSAEAILATLTELWVRPDLADAARQNAIQIRAQFGESAQESYRRLLMPLLQAA